MSDEERSKERDRLMRLIQKHYTALGELGYTLTDRDSVLTLFDDKLFIDAMEIEKHENAIVGTIQ